MKAETKKIDEGTESQEDRKRSRVLQSDLPIHTLEESLRIPRAIIDNYAGKPATPLQVASALELKPDSSQFRTLCGAAIAYGLTKGGYNAQEITVEPLTKRILNPLEEGDDLAAKREAVLKPRVLGDFINKYANAPVPRKDIALNVLADMGVPRDRVESAYQMILDTATSVKLVTEIKGKQYIDLSGLGAAGKVVPAESEEEAPQVEKAPITTTPEEKAVKKELGQGIFIAHGKNKKPLEQLKKILDQFKVHYKVAVDEPNLGRPISSKVKDTMESCNCAILIFTADDELFDKEGKSIWRPSENVVYELGASSYLYGSRIVILKEEGVEFSSNFQDLGYIAFVKDQLESKSMDVLKELIGFGILKVTT